MNKTSLEKLYVISEAIEGRRQILILETPDGGKLAAVANSAEAIYTFFQSLQETADATGRRYYVSEYTRTTDIAEIAKR